MMLKRSRGTFDALETSPASSTPPGGRLTKAMKYYHIDSDAFSDTSVFHAPYDSPSNPFGRVKTVAPRDLPSPTPVREHLVLRFQLAKHKNNVHRVAIVPANYTFWHLHRLTQFLFGFKDCRREKHPHHNYLRIERRTEHIFTIRKRITFSILPKYAGLIYDGSTVVRLAGNVEELKPQCDDDVPWEREECYTLAQVWNKPGSTSTSLRGVIYEHDVLSHRKASVHITIHHDANKIKASLQEDDDLYNTPHIVLGSGLPDDDDDDEDFLLDLQQFNEPDAFRNFILSQKNRDLEQEDDCPSIVRLAEEQALAKRRMSAPLPDHFPVDDQDRGDIEEDENLPPNQHAAPKRPPRKQANRRRSAADPFDFPDPEESAEVGAEPVPRELSPVKKETSLDAFFVHPDPQESVEIGADAAIGVERALRKRAPFAPVGMGSESAVVHKAKRMKEGFEPHSRNPEEKAGPQALMRKRTSFPPLGPDRRENDALRALYAAAMRRRSSIARLPAAEGKFGAEEHDTHDHNRAWNHSVRRHDREVLGTRKGTETTFKAEDDGNDENDEPAESEAEV